MANTATSSRSTAKNTPVGSLISRGILGIYSALLSLIFG